MGYETLLGTGGNCKIIQNHTWIAFRLYAPAMHPLVDGVCLLQLQNCGNTEKSGKLHSLCVREVTVLL